MTTRVSALALAAGLLLSITQTAAAAALSYVPGQDHFEVVYSYKIPPLAATDKAEVWLPVATSDAFQSLQMKTTDGGLQLTATTEPQFANHFLHGVLTPPDAGKEVTLSYTVERKEKAAYPGGAELKDPLYLRSEQLMPLNDRFRKLAADVTKGKTTDMEKAKAIYDHVFAEMKYDKSGTGWGRGDAVYACDAKTGNCTDFHALFIVLARSAGIPARFAIGFTIPAATDQGALEGYHCWAEFAANGQWVPVDISEASKDKSTKDYYFGHHPANRFQLTHGQQVQLMPPAQAGELGFIVHPYLEINGKTVKGTKGTYAYKRLTPVAAKS